MVRYTKLTVGWWIIHHPIQRLMFLYIQESLTRATIHHSPRHGRTHIPVDCPFKQGDISQGRLCSPAQARCCLRWLELFLDLFFVEEIMKQRWFFIIFQDTAHVFQFSVWRWEQLIIGSWRWTSSRRWMASESSCRGTGRSRKGIEVLLRVAHDAHAISDLAWTPEQRILVNLRVFLLSLNRKKQVKTLADFCELSCSEAKPKFSAGGFQGAATLELILFTTAAMVTTEAGWAKQRSVEGLPIDESPPLRISASNVCPAWRWFM